MNRYIMQQFIWVFTVFQGAMYLFAGIQNEKGFTVTNTNTLKPVYSGHSKIDKTKILHVMTNCRLIKVESIAECSPLIILRYFDLHYAIIGLENQV